ncbi:MAG: NADH-ubiquinone oxidoreductase-F iron-sulfur binding region domain-containing protein, partial [Lentisphaeria bacterium]
LIESIEGKRGIPRKRPPFPVTSGLNQLPTLMNNVETFACIPMIIADNGEAFNAIGTNDSHGTKAFALAGKVRQGGLIEVPIGISIGDIVENYGGGAEDEHTIKAVMIGGPSGGCIAKRRFDISVDYKTLQRNGAMMGSGGLVVLDECDCMVDLSLYFLRFLREESCGKCTMCREGIGQLCSLVEKLTLQGEKNLQILDRIEQLAKYIQQGSLCALGRTAPNMVLSALHEFRDEFQSHVKNQCPAGKCLELTNFFIDKEKCIGCTKCVQICAADAIACTPLQSAEISPDKCVKCGACRSICPENAVINYYDSYLENDPPLMPTYSPLFVDNNYVQIDDLLYEFVPNKTILDFAHTLKFTIPTLCYLKEVNETAHCMVCAVWNASLGRFVPACEQSLQPGHVYEINSPKVRDFRREAISLMLHRHDFKCGKCSAKGNCNFFDLVREYAVKKQKSTLQFPDKIVAKNVIFEAGKCILCQRCLKLSENTLTVHHRSDHSCISPAPHSWDLVPNATANVCPTGAISINTNS